MNPKDIGLLKTKLVLGKLSGRHAFKERIKELGYELTKTELDHAFTRFKLLTDKKKDIYDEDLEALVQDEKAVAPHIFTLEGLNISCGPIPTAGVKIRIGKDKIVERADTGDGPIDALYNAIDLSTGIQAKLVDYNIRSISRGKDAMGEVNIELEIDGQLTRGRAVSTDIIEGSGKAYLNAINKVASKLKKKKKPAKQK